MSLRADFERLELELERPFRIARGTTETAEVIVVRVSDGDREGVGGAGPSPYYGETADTVAAVLPDLLSVVESIDDPHRLDRIERWLRETVRGNPAARCAVSIAVHDLVAKRYGTPLYRYLGLDPAASVASSRTIGTVDPEATRERAAAIVDRGCSVLKVKLGDCDDLARVAAAREAAPDARIRVDANGAWTPRGAVEKASALAEHGVEFVEQPVPAEDPEGLKFVHGRSPLPIAVDESCATAGEVPGIADRCDVVNIKLMKCGGLREAIRTIHAARAHGLEVMLGCMVESNASIAAGCHLAPLADYADLDGSLLLADDPYDGVPVPGGEIDLASADRPGTGARSSE